MSDFLLEGTSRTNFGEDLLRARKSSPSSDADFANRTLRISLNTYKKCIDPGGAPLRLRRSTLFAIIKACKLDPARYGLEFAAPRLRSLDPRSYERDKTSVLERAFVQFRRLPLVTGAIAISTVTFTWDSARGLLTFQHFAPDPDNDSELVESHQGDVLVQNEESLFALLSIEDAAQLSLVQAPGGRASVPGRLQLRGIQLAPSTANGASHPLVSAIFLEDAELSSVDTATVASGTLLASHPAFDRLHRELLHIEDRFMPQPRK